jgi:hypothetical protein
MSGGIDLFTNEFDLTVDGQVTVGGAGTNLFIGGAAGSINADNVLINSGGTIELQGGLLTLDEEVGTSNLDIAAGGTLSGNGTITFADAPLAFTTVLSNGGTLTALSRPAIIFNPPPVGTLQINTTTAFELIDLDGAADAGVVNVSRNQTLDVNGSLSDAFGGTMTLFQASTFDMSNAWSMNAGTLTANNGFVAGGLGVPDTPAGTSFIKGGTFTQTGGLINVPDTDGTLQLDAPFTMSGGSFTNSGTVIFNGVTSITTAAGYAPSSISAQTVVNANVTINDGAGNFNWDGNGGADTTVNNGVLLSITASQVDTTDNVFGGSIILNDGSDLAVNVTATSWTLGGVLTKNDAGTSTISGDRVDVTGVVTVNGGTLDMPATTLSSTANVTANGLLTLGSASEFSGPAVLTGTGTLRMEGTSTVLANSTVNVATFDWDGLGSGTSHTINSGVTFTINSTTFDSDGDMDDPINLSGSGSTLIVNGVSQWTMNQAINANNAGAGTAVIGGTARMIMSGATGVINVNGDTTISAPVTFDGTSLVADIDSLMTLDITSGATTYAGGTIDGAGTFDPGLSNTVTGDFAINPDVFDFDGGSWTVASGATLTFNVQDYEPDSLTNSFENTINLNNGAMFANSADPAIVMNGTLNMNATGGNGAEWQGDAIQIGNDVGVLDAHLNVTGDGNVNSQGRFFAPVTFKSDADVNVPAGANLVFNGAVTFDSVNAANNAAFTGAGSMSFSNAIVVHEATTLNMVGGTVDLDGNDGVGDVINIDAPLTINAATVSNFGRVNGGGGTNTLVVDNNVGTGVLTVNLDDPAAEWTLNVAGALNLVNDNTPATLLAGNDVNVNGTLTVTGDVRTTARLDLAGAVTIGTAGEPLRLAGGDGGSNSNTIAGGIISGAGILGADSGKALHGFGNINTAIDFDGTANLKADNGVLTIVGALVDVNILGTADADGVLNIPNAWNSATGNGAGSIGAVVLAGGTLQGGTVTNDIATGIQGFGTITSRVINNTKLLATNGSTLVVQTAANDNDWDGATNAGELRGSGNTLELRDNATFGFTGTVSTVAGGRVFSNGFALDFNPGSAINLTQGTYESTSSTDIGGTVTIGAGTESTLRVANNFFTTFESTSATTLNGNLRLQNNNIIVRAGATFSGAGALVIDEPSHMVLDNGAAVNTLLVNEGTLRPGNFNGIGTATVKDYVQSSTGELFVELIGTLPNQYDRILASQTAQIDGYLNIDIDEVSPGVPFVPALGQTFDIISTVFGRSGSFDTVDVSGMPAGLAFHVDYLATSVRLTVVNKPIFAADFDDDGDVDMTDYSIWRSAYNLNQLGDANGDNQSNAADWVIWRDEFGSAPGAGALLDVNAAVPEPNAIAFLAVVTLCSITQRRRRNITNFSA